MILRGGSTRGKKDFFVGLWGLRAEKKRVILETQKLVIFRVAPVKKDTLYKPLPTRTT